MHRVPSCVYAHIHVHMCIFASHVFFACLLTDWFHDLVFGSDTVKDMGVHVSHVKLTWSSGAHIRRWLAGLHGQSNGVMLPEFLFTRYSLWSCRLAGRSSAGCDWAGLCGICKLSALNPLDPFGMNTFLCIHFQNWFTKSEDHFNNLV